MNIQAIEQLIQEHVGLIAVNAHALTEAKERAAKFLQVSAILLACLKETEIQLTKTRSVLDATYAQVMLETTGSKITEKKVLMEANPAYMKAREDHEQTEATREWIKNYTRLFDNAHILYRQYARVD